jgi:hypothetical protein
MHESDKSHRLRPSLEPGVEDSETGPILADSEDLAISPSLAVTTARPHTSVFRYRSQSALTGSPTSADPRGAALPVDVS